jgi:uncharacterized protein YutE (UPF0331/DUF86 family)
MVRVDLVTAKLANLGRRIARVRKHTSPSVEALREDQDALDLVSFNLMLSVQSAVDIASHIIADEGWRPATTLSEAFERLAENGVITKPIATAMGRATGLRNVVAHGYAAIDVASVYAAASSGVGDLEAFAAEVARWLQTRKTTG